jgi:hypothetical protein
LTYGSLLNFIMLLSTDRAYHFDGALIMTCHRVSFITANNKMVGQFTKDLAGNVTEASVASADLVQCTLVGLVPPELLFD